MQALVVSWRAGYPGHGISDLSMQDAKALLAAVIARRVPLRKRLFPAPHDLALVFAIRVVEIDSRMEGHFRQQSRQGGIPGERGDRGRRSIHDQHLDRR